MNNLRGTVLSALVAMSVSASPAYASVDTLGSILKRGGTATLSEGCLAGDIIGVKKAANFFSGVFGKTKLFDKSLFCNRNVVDVALISAYQIDLATYEAAQGLKAAYLALDYKEEDLKDLALVRKREVGEQFTSQSASKAENSARIIERRAEKLPSEIKQRKSHLSADTLEKLTEALGRIESTAFYQVKASLGGYLMSRYFTEVGPKEMLAIVPLAIKRGMTREYFDKLPRRLGDFVLNFDRIIEASTKSSDVLDETEQDAIEAAADKYIERGEDLSVVAAKQLADGSVDQDFSAIPEVDDVVEKSEEKTASNKKASPKSSGSSSNEECGVLCKMKSWTPDLPEGKTTAPTFVDNDP